jgi:lysophospholipase L1-like esterase
MRIMKIVPTAIGIGVAITIAGCSTGPAEPTPDPTTQIVVIGDSLIHAENGCDSCEGFVDQYAAHLEAALGRPAEVVLSEVSTVPTAQQALATSTATQDRIRAASVIIVEVGYNNALPDPATGIGCGGEISATATGFIDWIHATTPTCLAEGVATYEALYAEIFATIKELRGDAPTVFIVTSTINGNIGDPAVDSQGLLTYIPPADRADALAWTVDAYEQWHAMLEKTADDAGFAFVDVYRAIHGPTGTDPYFGIYTDDGAHLNAAGNDLVAQLLSEVDVSTLE